MLRMPLFFLWHWRLNAALAAIGGEWTPVYTRIDTL